MNYAEWLEIGIAEGWVGPQVCVVHDGLPTTAEEDEELEMGDPCIWILRRYTDEDVREKVEANHAPSRWRRDG